MFKEKILIIEDDVQIQNFMVYTLENAGFSFVPAVYLFTCGNGVRIDPPAVRIL